MYKNLAAIFKDSSVLFAYLFGSKATATDNADSDLDIAVMLPDNLSRQELFDKRLDLIAALSREMQEEVDVVIINNVTSLLMKYMIVSKGERIYCSDLKAALNFECLAYAKYFDFRPFLEDYRKSYVQRHL